MPNCIPPCASSPAPSGQLHYHGCPFSQILNHQLYDAELPQTSSDMQAKYHRDWPLYDYVFYPPLHLESRKPLWRDLQTIDVTSRWREDWQYATVVNSTLVVDPTIRLPGFDLHHRQWSLLNRFRTGQGHCNACHKKLGFNDNELCECGEIQTMSHIVNSCPLTKFDGGLLCLQQMRLPSTG